MPVSSAQASKRFDRASQEGHNFSMTAASMSSEGAADIAGCANPRATTRKPGRACAELEFPPCKTGRWSATGSGQEARACSFSVSAALASARMRGVHACHKEVGSARAVGGGRADEEGGLVPARGGRGLVVGSNDSLFGRVGRVRHGVALLAVGAVNYRAVPCAVVAGSSPGRSCWGCEAAAALLAAKKPFG